MKSLSNKYIDLQYKFCTNFILQATNMPGNVQYSQEVHVFRKQKVQGRPGNYFQFVSETVQGRLQVVVHLFLQLQQLLEQGYPNPPWMSFPIVFLQLQPRISPYCLAVLSIILCSLCPRHKGKIFGPEQANSSLIHGGYHGYSYQNQQKSVS